MTVSPQSRADKILLAAALKQHLGLAASPELFEKAARLGFHNILGQQAEIVWRLLNRFELEPLEVEGLGLNQAGMALMMAMQSYSSLYDPALRQACDPASLKADYQVEDSVCLDLARSLANEGATQLDRMVGTGLFSRLAKQSENAVELAAAARADQLVKDLRIKSRGLACRDGGRTQTELMGSEAYLADFISRGECAALSSIIQRVESGQL